MGCVHPVTGRVIAHRTPPRVPEKVRHVVVSVPRRFLDPPPRTPWGRTKYFHACGGQAWAHGGGRKSQKIDFWKLGLYRSWVLSGVTGHLLRPLGVSRALRDPPEPPTGHTSPAPPASVKKTGRGNEQNSRKSRKIDF